MFPLISIWTILPGNEAVVLEGLAQLAVAVKQTQPGTLAYLVHTPDLSQPSLPTPAAGQVIFFEVYRDKAAFDEHVSSKAFLDFVDNYGPMFLSTPKGGPYNSVGFLTHRAGYIRPELAQHLHSSTNK